MKLSPSQFSRRAFTLVEALVVTGIFTLVIAATVSLQVFGMKMCVLSEHKLLSTGDARSAINRVGNEIRSAKILFVGSGDTANFTAIADNSPRSGSALKICPTSDTNQFVCYFWDSATSSLRRGVSGGGSDEILANYVTNQLVFTAEDYRGTVINNNSDNRVIRMTLEFFHPQYSMNKVGNEYYHLQTRITRRVIE